jgi:hypothetical protein
VQSLGRHVGRFRGDAPYAHRDAIASTLPLALFACAAIVIRDHLERLPLVPLFALAVYVLLRAIIILGAWLRHVDLYEHGLVTTTLLGRSTAILWTDVRHVHQYYPGPLRGLTIKTNVPFRTAYMPWPVCNWESFSQRVTTLAGIDNPLTQTIGSPATGR